MIHAKFDAVTGRGLFRSMNNLMIPRPYDAFVKENFLYMISLSKENGKGYDLNGINSDWRCIFKGGQIVNGSIVNEEPCMRGRHVQVITCEVPDSVNRAWSKTDPKRELAQSVTVTAISRKKGSPFKYDRIEFCRYPPAQEWKPGTTAPG